MVSKIFSILGFVCLLFLHAQTDDDLMKYYMKLTMILTPFYPKLNDTQRQAYLDIVQNTDLTKAELTQQLQDWGKDQPQEIQVGVL